MQYLLVAFIIIFFCGGRHLNVMAVMKEIKLINFLISGDRRSGELELFLQEAHCCFEISKT